MDSGKASPESASTSVDPFVQPLFAAIIQPHRSLDARGFRILMILCCLGTAAASVPFVILGLWPVAGFFGLDLVALYVAFRISFRSGRSFEEIVLSPIELMFRRVGPRGERREWRFNPLWTKIDREDDDEFGLQRLRLVSRGEQVTIAGPLSPPERESFAEALGEALSRVKRAL
ncbi:MAG TPA: DUF2244 domain-containing protein [Beijerinckiaceae bacterium]|jgi:uncharacterized membrane protein|nr:DUF2244 domain-containing protein [Beijerinckiaceae bacterium]